MQLSEEPGLFEGFPPLPTSTWEAVIEKDLKGADYAKKLIWKTPEGFDVKPYYRAENADNLAYLKAEPGMYPFVRGFHHGHNRWKVHQTIVVDSVEEANRKAKCLIASEVASLGFTFSKHKTIDREAFIRLLEGLTLSGLTFHFYNISPDRDIVQEHIRTFTPHASPEEAPLFLWDDGILNTLNQIGAFNTLKEEEIKRLSESLLSSVSTTLSVKQLHIDGTLFGKAGSTIVQELAFSMALGAWYMGALTDRGLDSVAVLRQIWFSFCVGPNYFMEIARLRAARYLWTKIASTFCPNSNDLPAMYIHSVTATINKTVADPHTNLLRATTEAMSAILGGCSSLEVLPYDVSFKAPTVFSERLARNIQHILREEAWFDKVADPAAGSYYIENLTHSLIHHAWELFLIIQAEGGYIEAFRKGTVQTQVEAAAEKHVKLVNTGKEVLLGINRYPDSHFPVDIISNEPGSDLHPEVGHLAARPLQRIRLAKDFEQLRQQVASRKRIPVVFLLPIGHVGMCRARAGFAAGFFACAGYRVIDHSGFDSVEEGVRKALSEKADIVVLCSSDDEYATFAPQASKAINGRTILVIAGDPACRPELEADGIINFISLRSPLLETLLFYHQQIEK